MEALAAALNRDDVGLRCQAAVSLGQIGPPSVEPLLAAPKHENAGVRQVAAVGLGVTKDCRAAEPLAAALSDIRRASALGSGGSIGAYWERAHC